MYSHEIMKQRKEQVPIGTKMRPSDFSLDETDDCRDENHEAVGEPRFGQHSISNLSQSSRAYFTCSERMYYGPTSRPTDGQSIIKRC